MISSWLRGARDSGEADREEAEQPGLDQEVSDQVAIGRPTGGLGADGFVFCRCVAVVVAVSVISSFFYWATPVMRNCYFCSLNTEPTFLSIYVAH